MPRRRMRRLETGGYTFDFTYDLQRTSELHIEKRAGLSPQVAVDTFFESKHAWNQRRTRFECFTEAPGLYWTWLYGDEASGNVLVISCFPLEED